MRRLYTRQQYLERVGALRQAVPDIALSTDLIVGFPGESEEDFQETLSLLRQVRYDSIFAFKYSARPLTPAATYPDQLSGEAKTERIHTALKLQDEIALERNRGRVGTVEEILIEEGPNPKMQSTGTGRTRRNQLVHFSQESLVPGDTVSAVIAEGYSHYLKGKIP
jgi:tRNA-2-methylthio-N6-dimethylallyladenosine synthase